MSSSAAEAQRPVYTAEERSSVPKPSAKQIYCLLHLAVDLLGLEWPADRRAASDLIARLSEHARTVTPTDAPAF
jgi:hypothetical protein